MITSSNPTHYKDLRRLRPSCVSNCQLDSVGRHIVRCGAVRCFMSTLDLQGAATKHPHYKNRSIFQIIHLRSFQALFVRHHGTGSGSLYATCARCGARGACGAVSVRCFVSRGARGARGVCGAVFRDTQCALLI